MAQAKLIPLNVLVNSMGAHSDENYGLTACFQKCPEVRSYGFSYTEDEFWAALRENEVNTVIYHAY